MLAGVERDREPRIRSALIAALIPGTGLVAFAAVRLSGGSPNPLNHLGYLPILIAAFAFGWRGATLTAVLVGVLLGPLAAWLGLSGGVEELGAWTIRAVMFGGVALITGSLFDQSRRSMLGWRTAAVEIAQRERDGMIALARGAEAKDSDTGDHIVRVQLLSEELAKAASMSLEEAVDIGWSAMLHDVGKLHIPDSILRKPGPLDAGEWAVMRQHPIYGERILEHGKGFETARVIARWHHENIDGSGYPDGLKGERIPFPARVVRVADAFDAITSHRPYKPARSVEWAMAELERCAGTQFDPELVALFLELLQKDPGLIARLAEHNLAASQRAA
jgi:hypothetical protein